MKNNDDIFNLAYIILNAVNTLQVGKHKLACFLKGSKSKDVIPISHKNIFGGLLWHDIPTIEGYIDQLEKMEFIKRVQVDEFYSYLALSEAGKKAIDEKLEIPLQIIKEKKPVTVGESELLTLNLFKQGKKINDIAKERNLVQTTIYTHLYRLIVNGYLHSNEVIDEEKHKLISNACAKFKNQPSLREIKEMLPPEISYEEIRCVAADYYKGGIENEI